METHQARAFLAVARHLHFGSAAKELNLAPSALSRTIKQLERSLGVSLFERSTRKVALTPAGQVLKEPAAALVQIADGVRGLAESAASGYTGRVRIGFAGAGAGFEVARLVRRVRSHCPGIDIDLRTSQFSHQALDGVCGGELDLAYGRWDYLPSSVDSELIATERLMIALPAAHSLAGRDSLSMGDLSRESWIVLPGDSRSAITERLNSLTRAAGFKPRILQTAPDPWTQAVLIEAGMGCALSLDSVRRSIESAGVTYVPLRNPGRPIELRLIWRADETNEAVGHVRQLATSGLEGK